MKKSRIWIVLFLFVTSVYAASDNKQVQKGKEAFGKREYAKSITIFKKLIESDPEQGDYFVFLGAAYCKNGQFKEAVDACQKSLNLPHAKEWENLSWTILAEANEELGRFDAAISSKKKSIELDPNSSDNFAGLSKLYNDNQQNDEAITAAKRAIELKPDAWFAFYNLGVAYGRKEQYAEAIEALKKAIEIEPKEIRVYAAMAFFFAEQGDYAEAIEAYKKAIEAAGSTKTQDVIKAIENVGWWDTNHGREFMRAGDHQNYVDHAWFEIIPDPTRPEGFRIGESGHLKMHDFMLPEKEALNWDHTLSAWIKAHPEVMGK